jgi:hypothetical protein
VSTARASDLFPIVVEAPEHLQDRRVVIERAGFLERPQRFIVLSKFFVAQAEHRRRHPVTGVELDGLLGLLDDEIVPATEVEHPGGIAPHDGRHRIEPQRPFDLCCGVVAASHDQSSDTEVEDLQVAVGCDEEVFRFEVAVDDPVLVRGCQRFRRLLPKVNRGRCREGAAVKPLAQRLAFEQFRHDEGSGIGVADVVDAHDTGMTDASCRPGLELEPAEHFWIRRRPCGQHFDRDIAAEAFVACSIDFAHRARPKRRDDLIGAEANTSGKPHRTAAILQ